MSKSNADRSREYLYGMSSGDYEILMMFQNRSCAICGKTSEKLVVDHDHITGLVRGLLCQGCNVGLGQFGDSTSGLRAALVYLETSHSRAIELTTWRSRVGKLLREHTGRISKATEAHKKLLADREDAKAKVTVFDVIDRIKASA